VAVHARGETPDLWPETEYGLTCAANGQRRLSPDRVAQYLFGHCSPNLRTANAFLENGARLYLDTGFHPEYATPECDNILDLIVHDEAGERVMEDLARDAEQRLRADGLSASILLFKNNADTAGNAYGCHENYLVSRRISLQALARTLIPFFVTRQILAGAGKLLPTPTGVRFCLSQRAQHIVQEISGATTSCRSIINTRDETHADIEQYRRLHVIVGDSNMSEISTFMKVGTTALILDMIEDGLLDADYRLESPVAAIRELSADPLLQRTVKLKDGRAVTALELQTEYLGHAVRYVELTGDDESVELARRWEDVLRELEREPGELSADIDWVIKRELIDAYQQRHQLSARDARLSLIDLQYHDIRREEGLYSRLLQRGAVTRLTTDAPSRRRSPGRRRPPEPVCAANSSARPRRRGAPIGPTGRIWR
jgi:proteasome accessory factor A